MPIMTFLPILVSAIASYLVSALWYLVVFRAPYIEALGKTTEQLAKGPSGLQASVLQVIGNLVLAGVLAWLMARLGYTSVQQGMLLGGLVWLGFVVAVLGPLYAFEANSPMLLLLNAGSVLLTLLITGAILGGWRV